MTGPRPARPDVEALVEQSLRDTYPWWPPERSAAYTRARGLVLAITLTVAVVGVVVAAVVLAPIPALLVLMGLAVAAGTWHDVQRRRESR